MSALPRPSASGAFALERLTTATRFRAGGAWGQVARWEADVRQAWLELVSAEPTPGTARALGRLADEARRLVEAPGSVLAHAVRTAPTPWRLDAEPFRGLGERIEQFLAGTLSVRELLARQREAVERLRALEGEWRPRFPRGWTRETQRHGVSAESILRSPGMDALRAVEERMKRVRSALEGWNREVDAWLLRMGAAAVDAGGDAASPEERYEALLSIGAVDRHALQLRTAALLRAGVKAQLQGVRPREEGDRGGWPVRMAEAWLAHAPEGPLAAEEAAAYREALRELHLRRARTPRPGSEP